MLLILFLVRLAMGYQFQSIASVSNHLIDEFGFTYTQIGTLIGFFLLPGIIVAMPSGLLTRAVTDKNLLMIGAALMVAGSSIMAFGATPGAIYWGRLSTGVGGTIFNVILTKMVTDWFYEKEIITALSVMLTAWPVGMAIGLLTQGLIADLYGWPWAMHASSALAVAALLLTATLYKDAARAGADNGAPLRFTLPARQFAHMSIIGLIWTLYNVFFIIVVSFSPGILIDAGYTPGAARAVTSLFLWVTLISLPFGGRVLEAVGHVTPSMIVTLLISCAVALAIADGMAPEAMFIALGIFAGIPGGALLALTAQGVQAQNRGTGLGIFYTYYYIGMAACPPLAGWARDITGNPSAPLLLGIVLIVMAVVLIGALRLLQRTWPIEVEDRG